MPNRLAHYCEGIMEAAWLLALILTPLFFNIYSSRVFEPDKAVLLRSLALLALAGWLGQVASRLPTGRGIRWSGDTLGTFLRIPLAIPVLALAGVYTISTLLSVAPLTSLFGSYQRLQGALTSLAYVVLFITVAAHLRRRAQVERLLTAAILTSLPVSLYGILQRFHLDPMPWGSDVSTNVTSSLGNAAFLGAYLILVVPIVLGRIAQVVQTLRTKGPTGSVVTQWLRLVIYLAVLGLDLTALGFTHSFTAWLALTVGLLFFGGMLAFIWRSRALSLVMAGLTVLTILGAVVFGAMMQQNTTDGSQVSQRVRVLISQGVAAMMKSPSPLQYPDGHADLWAAVRPLIGYGPETLYVTFNRYSPPELAWQGVRGASPDRAYNETLDALATTGWAGVAVYLALFATAFLTAFKGLGMLSAPGRSTWFWGLALGGITAGAALYGAWLGPEAVGLGLAFGLAAGMGVFVIGSTFRPASVADAAVSTAPRDPWRTILLASLSAVLMAHLVEINLGIAITPTRTYFWLLLAVVWALGAAPEAFQTTQSAGKTESQASTEPERKVSRTPWQPVVASAALIAVLLMVLGFDFVANPMHSTNPIQIVVETLTVRNNNSGAYGPYGILALVLVTWIVGGVLAYLEETSHGNSRIGWWGIGLNLILGLALGFAFWFLLAWQHVIIVATPPDSIETLLAVMGKIAALPASLCLALLLLVIVWAVALPTDWPAGGPLRLRSVAVYVGGGVVVLGALVATAGLSLRVIEADIIYKTAMQFDQQNQPQVAVPVFQQTVRIAPLEDYYDMFLGRAYLNLAQQQSTPEKQTANLSQAESVLKTAQRLDPLNTDHAANLARLYNQWALLNPIPADRPKLIQQSEAAYALALRLSPNNASLWNEWAKVSLQLAQAPDETQKALDHSLTLDTTLGQTYQIQGDLYVWRARQAADEAGRKAFAEQAVQAYQAGIGKGDAADLHAGLAQAYELEGLYPMASQQYLQAIQMMPTGSPDLWQLYRQLGGAYEKAGDAGQARLYGQKALDAAPAASRAEIQAWLKTLP